MQASQNSRDISASDRQFSAITLTMCFIVALLEGFDIQSMGVVAPFVKAQFSLSTGELAWVFSAATLGMFPGAVVGGRLADKYGRKRVLMVSVAIFGLMSLATAFCNSFLEFVLARFLTGIGMGAALPLMIAMASESVSAKHNGTAVSIMYAGVPIGAAITALIARNFANPTEWIHIFYLGGIVPILVLPLLQIFLKETIQRDLIKNPVQATTDTQSFNHVLFSKHRFALTLQVWISFFCTLIVLYFILNWLPILMKANGLDNKQVGMIQLMYQVGAAIGTIILGQILDRINIRWVVIIIYAGILAGLICLSMSTDYGFLVFAAALCGFFLTGGQSVLYALAALVYPSAIRGTGVGSAVAVGRVGSFVGPLLAGWILSISSSSSAVIGASIPVIAIAAAAAVLLAIQLGKRTNNESFN